MPVIKIMSCGDRIILSYDYLVVLFNLYHRILINYMNLWMDKCLIYHVYYIFVIQTHI